MAKRLAIQLFEIYYEDLVCSLDLNDTNFTIDLSKYNLLSENIIIGLKEKSTTKEKVSYFLNNVIKTGLEGGDDTCFVKLLTVMKNSEYPSVKKLAEDIESKYDFGAKG